MKLLDRYINSSYFTLYYCHIYLFAVKALCIFICNCIGRPRFTDIPTNISASAGNNVTLICTAFAVPEAIIVWSHTSLSGVERDLNDRTNVQINGNTITISNVDYFRDGGKYTCTASNNHGSIKTDAHINLDCECHII